MSIVDSNLPTSGRSASITTIDHHKRQQTLRLWESMDEGTSDFFHDFFRAMRLAKHHNSEATAALLGNWQPTSTDEVILCYQQLLGISADAITAKLNQQAANDN